MSSKIVHHILNNDDKTVIKKIFHMSDLHIIKNKESCVDSYRIVFEHVNKLLQRQKEKGNDFVVVITGDLLHYSNRIDSLTNIFLFHFLKNLLSNCPVFIISGNHDINMNNPKIDILTSILLPHSKQNSNSYYCDGVPYPYLECKGPLANLYFLRHTGFYLYANLLFNVKSLIDIHDYPADEILSLDCLGDLNISKRRSKFFRTISLYHGLVVNDESSPDLKSLGIHTKKFTTDFVMLGDCHRHRFLQDKSIAYAGSLIAQNFKEGEYPHGIVKWNLFNKEKTKFIEIKNPYHFVTIHIKNGTMIDTDIPPKPLIRFILENSNLTQCNRILKKIKEDHDVCRVKIISNSILNKIIDNINYTGDHTKQIKTFLIQKNVHTEQINEILALHENVKRNIFNEQSIQNRSWRIKKLTFSGIMNFKENNVIEFELYQHNTLLEIRGDNKFGKSSILDIILFCIFEKIERGQNKQLINKKSNQMHCSILINVENTDYLITRIGTKTDKGITFDVEFCSIKHNKKRNLTESNKRETNQKIAEIVGNYDDFLTSNILLQDPPSCYEFTKMTSLQKKEYLTFILELNVYDKYVNCVRIKKNELANRLKNLKENSTFMDINEIKKAMRLLIAKQKYTQDMFDMIDLKLEIHRRMYHRMHPRIKGVSPKMSVMYTIKSISNKYRNMMTDEIMLSSQLRTLDKQIKMNQALIVKHDSLLKEMEVVQKQLDLHELYIQMVGMNELSYEIIRNCFLLIEQETNKILKLLVPRSGILIRLLCNNEDSKRMELDVCVCCMDKIYYDIRMICGFEKILVSLALRLVFNKISVRPKPNFIILDESWKWIDSDNKKYVEGIMDYVKMQFGFVMMISHDDELKELYDYVIGLGKDKKNGVSYVVTE